jgi:hypothetical protein
MVLTFLSESIPDAPETCALKSANNEKIGYTFSIYDFSDNSKGEDEDWTSSSSITGVAYNWLTEQTRRQTAVLCHSLEPELQPSVVMLMRGMMIPPTEYGTRGETVTHLC